MKILITGISGFIGTHLTKILLSSKHEIIGLDKKKLPTSNDMNNKKIAFFQGDIIDKKILLEAMSTDKNQTKIDLIIHLAAEHQDFGITKDIFLKVNRDGTKNILECAKEKNIKRIIYYSSVAVYGYKNEATTESSSTDTTESYGISKLEAEKEIKKWYDNDSNNSAIIIRPTVVYGPNMNKYANIYRLIDSINKKKFMFVGKCENIKSIAYVENIVAATEFLMNKIDKGYHIFNYSNSTHYTAKNIALIISKSLKKPIPKFILPYNLTFQLGKVFDVFSKVTKINLPITADRVEKFNKITYHKADKIIDLGFKAKYTNEEGLIKACDWFLCE